MEKLLTKFLDVGLLSHLSTNEQVGFIESAVAEVTKKLAKHRGSLITYTLAAFHPNISKENPIIKEVDEALKKHWKTIQNNISDEPRQIWRTIIWEALNHQAKDNTAAAVIWFTAGNIFPYAELDTNERKVIAEFLLSLRDKVEKAAVSLWYHPNQSASQNLDFDFSIGKSDLKGIAVDGFKQDLMKAAGPTDAAGTTLEDANRHWTNNNGVWSETFADKASKAISKRINSSAANLANDLYSQLEEFTDELKNKISQLNHNLIAENTFRHLRNELLWWRQTLYSPILQKGYRELTPAIAAFTIAADLHQLISGIHPISVEYLLRETFRATEISDFDKVISLKSIAEEIVSNSDSRVVDSKLGNYYKAFSEQLPLSGIVKKSIVSSSVSDDDFNLLGLEANAEISLSEFSVWIFRDLQAYRLATNK